MAADRHDPVDWDERYAERPDGARDEPHPALVDLVADLDPGRCVDVGCGEGVDAVWLAEQGWEATGIDASRVALDHARELAADRGVDVRWEQADVAEWLPEDRYDLVSCIYPGVPRRDGLADRIAGLVAPGGRFLGVWHGPDYADDVRARGFDPDHYLQADHVVPAVTGWALVVDELRRRGDGEDRVITARRKPA